jgi:hypothetical protein
MSAMPLALRIDQWTDIDRLRTVRLAVCHSADSSARSARDRVDLPFAQAFAGSLAAQLSSLLRDVTVRGYAGKVTSSCSAPAVWRLHQEQVDLEYGLSHYFRIDKSGGADTHYHCVTFLNGKAVRQAYPIHSEDGLDYAVL